MTTGIIYAKSKNKAKIQEIRFISPEPVLAEILSKHKPILISEAGWKWIVQWIADIGVIMRSRDYIAFNIAYTLSYALMEGVFTVFSKLGIAEKVGLLKRWTGR